MTEPTALKQLATELALYRTPPMELLTRWQLLLGEDRIDYLDAALDTGTSVPGTRYTFLAITDVAVCYLVAESDDEYWEHDPHGFHSGRLRPPLTAWRRPLTAVTEIGLTEDSRDWWPDEIQSRAQRPAIRLLVGGDALQIPLYSRRMNQPQPDVAQIIARLTKVWRTST